MEIYDIVMLVVLVGATLFGAIKGFAWQLASIASIIVSYLVAYHFREPFSESINAQPPWNRFLAMLILYVGTSLVIWVLFRMISRTIDQMRLKEFDRQIGALFGLAKGGLYCVLITLFSVTLLGDGIRDKIVGSRSGHTIARVLDRSQAVIPPELHEIVDPVLAKFDRKFNGSQTDDSLYPSWPGGQDNSESIGRSVWGTLGASDGPPAGSTGSGLTRSWQSGQSTPIQSLGELDRTARDGYQQLQQTYGQAQQVYDQFRETTNQVRQGVGQFGQSPQPTSSQPQGLQPIQQSYGRPEPVGVAPIGEATWNR